MDLKFKHAIIGAALTLSLAAFLACGGSTPAAQPAPAEPADNPRVSLPSGQAQPTPAGPAPTQTPALVATSAPVVARADTPIPPSSTAVSTSEPAPTVLVPTPGTTGVPTKTTTSVPTAVPQAVQASPQPADTPTSAPTQPTATEIPAPTLQPTATQVPPTTTATSTAVPTSTPEPTVAPMPQAGSDVGDLAPDFTLPSARGDDYPLSAYRGHSNIVLVFYRAFW